MFAEYALLPVGTEGNHLATVLATVLHTGAAPPLEARGTDDAEGSLTYTLV